MNGVARLLGIAGIVLAGQLAAPAQSAAPPTPVSDWPVATAPARFVIERDHVGPIPPLGWVKIYLPDPRWETRPLRVFTDKGVAVGSDLIWTAPGEPATLVFDASANSKYFQIYVGSTWPPMHLSDLQAGVWLESREGDGAVITKAADMLEAWKQASGKVVGRAIDSAIYEGGNRFGPQRNLLLHFQGWFDLDTPTHLDFAPISNDATFVFVDGKEVVEWPGAHDWHYGPAGPPQGGVDLPAGRHGIDYYNAAIYTSNRNHPILCSLSVKGGKFKDWTTPYGANTFYRIIGNYYVTKYEVPTGANAMPVPGDAPTVALSTSIDSEDLIDAEQDVGMVNLNLNCLAAVTGTLTWNFDDGGSAQGLSVKHLFLRPGLRTVKLTTQQGDKTVTLLTQTLRVRLRTQPVYGEGPQFLPGHEADIMGRDPAAMSATDLVSCFAMFASYEKWDGFLKILPAVCGKMPEMATSDLPYLRTAAQQFTQHDRAHDAEQMQLLRALIDRAGQGTVSPDMLAGADQGRLALARLLLANTDQFDEVRKLCDAIKPASLTGNDPRALALLRADLALATGDVASAKKQYEDLTGPPSGSDLRSSIRRTAKLGQARAYLAQKDFESAEDALHEVAWNAPIEKLSPDWALTELRLRQQQNLTVIAYLWAKRLLPVIKGDARSELLFRLTELAFAQKDDALAHQSLAELLKKFPYSAEAAQAKEKWPGSQ